MTDNSTPLLDPDDVPDVAPVPDAAVAGVVDAGVVVVDVVDVVVDAGVVVVDVVDVVGCWKVIGTVASVTPWAWTVTWVVPNGRGKFSVAGGSPAGTDTGAGDVALVPLNVIVNSVSPSAANADELSVIPTDPPVAVAAPAAMVAVEFSGAGISKSATYVNSSPSMAAGLAT